MNIKLKSGKEFYASNGILGIGPNVMSVLKEGENEIIAYGYDGFVYVSNIDGEPEFTQNELIEIAEIAIERWTMFKKQVALGFIQTRYK